MLCLRYDAIKIVLCCMITSSFHVISFSLWWTWRHYKSTLQKVCTVCSTADYATKITGRLRWLCRYSAYNGWVHNCFVRGNQWIILLSIKICMQKAILLWMFFNLLYTFYTAKLSGLIFCCKPKVLTTELNWYYLHGSCSNATARNRLFLLALPSHRAGGSPQQFSFDPRNN